MKKTYASLLSWLLICLSGAVYGQFQGNIYQEYADGIKVYKGSVAQDMAWAGGFNNPQVCMADLNHDNIIDLVIFESTSGQVKTFINYGTAGNPKYVYSPHYSDNFPYVNNYLKLLDYNCDGIPDLFTRGNTGISVSKGYYNASNELTFTFYKELYYDSPVFGHVNAYVQPTDIPGIGDIDGDGDIDFVSYSIAGEVISLYKNCAKEHGLPCDSITICLSDNCWGKSYQPFVRPQVLNYSCDETGTVACRSTDSAGKGTLHSGNTICLVDVDGDGDMDYFDGNISFSDIQLMINGKTQYGGSKDSMMSQDTLWQTGGVAVNMPQWPAAFYEDIDQDGKKDMLFSPHAEYVSENYKCLAFYKNTGTASVPSFTYQTDTLLMDQTIDLGTAATPFLYDYDKDGKPDLFIGSDGYYQPGGSLKSRVSYYQNTSTPGNPSFTLITTDFLGMSAQNFAGTSIAVGDLNNDGKDDMVVGHADGTMSFYNNTASSNSVQPVWQLTQLILKDISNYYIDAGNYAAPFIYDINKDGKPDLLIGYQAGYVYYYQNEGNANQLLLQMITNKLGNVRADVGIGSYCVPFIGKMDNTGNDYFLVGGYGGSLYRYDGFQTGNTSGNYQRIDSVYSNIHLGPRAAPAIADIDGDGKYEMVLGNLLGGVHMLKQVNNVSVQEIGNSNSYHCRVYPNPAANELNIEWDNNFADNGNISIVLYNVTGQKILEQQANAGNKKVQLNTSGIVPGIYSCMIQCAGKRFVTNVTILK
ncbi:T9SS type A sorting domain-containing protein [Chitinophagaceae bacterium MMS25-I14]